MISRITIIALLLIMIAGCGGPAADVTIFIMTPDGMNSDSAAQIETSLKEKVGATPTIRLNASPIFNMQKMTVEIAAGGNGIIIIPKEQLLMFTRDGGMVNLDQIAKPQDFPEGVFEIPIDADKTKKEKHVYAIPMNKVKWYTDAGLNGQDMFAFIPQNAPNLDKAMIVLKGMLNQ